MPFQPNSTLNFTTSGYAFRDLNKNGRLDIYEDPRQPIEVRVADLMTQMTLEEKAGLMFMNGATVNADATLEADPEEHGFAGVGIQRMDDHNMNHFNLWQIPAAAVVAKWQNNLQRYAEGTRLGIPVTIASDPRNHFSENIFAMAATDFSQWCETLGFGGLADPDLVVKFAGIARREYLAVGIRVALHPQIDLATEPRWARISGTFGEDAQVSARLVKAYIKGFQGAQLGPHSVACMTKHFPGGGPQNEGLDPHFEFHKGQIYPSNNFEYHLIPFQAAIQAGTASMMPYYGVPIGQTNEDVAMAFNKTIITTLLRERFNFNGVVCTDWGLITDSPMGEIIYPARAWGLEHLSERERVLKAILAGVDQFGGENCPYHIVSLVRDGQLSLARLDESVRRLLRQKFQLGLFDDPFVDESEIAEVFSDPEAVQAGTLSQQRAMTLLKNKDDILPLNGNPKIFIQHLDQTVAAGFGIVVADPADADLAILRLSTPWIPVETKNPFARGFHHGDLDFKGDALAGILRICQAVPTIVVINLDRPAVIPEINAAAAAVLADFGASDLSVLRVLFGHARLEGRLPFELPASMEAVRNQKTDLPYDSVEPLYPFGFGSRYK